MTVTVRQWYLGIPAVTAVCCVFLLFNFHLVPDPMPVHFGPRGEPDAWATKSLASALGLIAMAPGMLLFTGLLAVGMMRVSADGAGPRQTLLLQEMGPRLAAYLFWLSAIIGVSVTGSLLGHNGPLSLLFLVGGMVLATGVFMWQLVRLHRRVDAVHPPSEQERRGRWGFLYDRDNPEIFVPLENGINVAFNMARPGAWGIVGLLMAIPILITLLTLLAG